MPLTMMDRRSYPLFMTTTILNKGWYFTSLT